MVEKKREKVAALRADRFVLAIGAEGKVSSKVVWWQYIYRVGDSLPIYDEKQI